MTINDFHLLFDNLVQDYENYKGRFASFLMYFKILQIDGFIQERKKE